MSPNARILAFGLMAGAASAGLLLLSASGSMGAALLSYAAAFPLALVGLTVGDRHVARLKIPEGGSRDRVH